MSSCLSGGGGRAYGFDLDIVKSSSPSPSTRSSHSSSPSSTLSESSNSPLAISTKRARTPRKRPDQTYKEAAALLSTVYPNIFSAKSLRKLRKHARPYDSFPEPSELLPPFPTLGDAGFLLHQHPPEKPNLQIEPKPANSPRKACLTPPSTEFREPDSPGLEEDFDAESILDEEIGVGIDSIMGNLSVNNNNNNFEDSPHYSAQIDPYLGNTMGFGLGGKFVFGLGFGHGDGNMRRALRRTGDGDWWQSPTVEVLSIAPKLKASSSSSSSSDKKKKKKKKVELKNGDSATTSPTTQQQQGNLKSGLSLKLNYEEVLKEWSNRGSPFSDAGDSPESRADTIEARLARIDLFPEMTGSVREASVMRYKEKRRTRLFSKKIRYQVRKVNADTRPRMQGRFVRRPTLSFQR